MLILLAGLQSIPREVTEAATIDGANGWQRFRWVTLPLLRPVLFFVLVIEAIGSFQVFDAMYVMTGGGPVRASYSLVYFLYDSGFKFFDFGYASAVGLVLFLVVLSSRSSSAGSSEGTRTDGDLRTAPRRGHGPARAAPCCWSWSRS